MDEPTSPKPKSKGRKFDAPENPYEAAEAIRNGQVEPIGSYLRYDVAEILNLLADQIETAEFEDGPNVTDAETATAPAQQDEKTAVDGANWNSNTWLVLDCVREAQLQPVAWFLRDLAGFLQHLGRAFDPNSNLDQKLTFSRRRAGKPIDQIKEMRRRSAVHFHYRMLRLKHGKKEADIQEVMEKFDLSRSQVLKILQSFKSHQNQE